MPRGQAAFGQHQQRVEERKAAMGERIRADFFDLKGGEMAVLRFLEQGDELAYAICHRLAVEGSQYPQDVLCADQNEDGTPCPLCQSTNKDTKSRSTKGFVNVLWRGGPAIQAENQRIQQIVPQPGMPMPTTFKLAPVYKRNDQGFLEKDDNKQKIVTGFADGVFLWKCSKTIYEMLLEKDATYRGLMTRDFVVSRKGSGISDTKYFIEPFSVDSGPQPMTVADIALAQNKYDLDAITKAPSYEDLAARLGGGMPSAAQFTRQIPAPESDAFGGAPMRSSAFQRPGQ